MTVRIIGTDMTGKLVGVMGDRIAIHLDRWVNDSNGIVVPASRVEYVEGSEDDDTAAIEREAIDSCRTVSHVAVIPDGVDYDIECQED